MDNLRYIIRKTLSEAVKKRKYYTTWKKLMGEDIEEINATVGNIVAKVTDQLGISKYHLAGTGTQGYAYYIPNNRILKITTDRSEPVESKKIMGKNCKHLANIYNVFSLKGKYEGVYVIISELLDKSEKVDESYENLGLCLKVIGTHGDVNRLFSRYKDGILKKDEMESLYQRIKALPVSDASKYTDSEKESALWMFKELIELIDELNSNNIHSTDYINVNLGLKKNGRLAMHDLGYSPNKDSDAEILYIDEYDTIPNLDYPDFLDPQYNKGMQNTPYPPMENPNRAPMRETQISPEELGKKNLPLKHHNLWSEFLQANSAALGDILPTLSRQYANVETIDTIKSIAKDNPALYDQFAEWIFNHLKQN
jgi:hypothetical protein